MEVDSSIKKFCKEFDYKIDDFTKESLPENRVGFFYESRSEQATLSFYLLPKSICAPSEFKAIHKRIWSEDRADLYITVDDEGGKIYYAKTLPENALKEGIKIDSFSYGAFKPSEMQEKFEEFKKRDCLKKTSVDSGLFIEAYRERLREIQKENKSTVDDALISTIVYLREHVSDYIEISNRQRCKEVIEALIDRSIFIKFLEDRGLLTRSIYGDGGEDLNSYKDILNLDDIDTLNNFFEQINKKFNGDLFSEPKLDKQYFTAEKSLVKILELFIKGAAVEEGASGTAVAQLPLFDYEFSVIPVELLSTIYESFLEEDRKRESIYYTPLPIVDIILRDTLEEYLKTEGSRPKILDPSCGSGNFLVSTFKRLIEYDEKNGRNDNRSTLNDRANLLQDCIFGIDKDPIATRITIFSLYLSLFEGFEENKDILKDFEFPKLLNKNIMVKNSLSTNYMDEIIFTDSKNERIEHFDICIGNPPWGKIQENTDEHDFYVKNDDKICDKEISQAFITQIPVWSHPETRFGLIIKGTNFLNPRNEKFVKFFFENFILEKYYDLTKARGFIFKHGKFSASIIIFKHKNESNRLSKFLYYQPIESRLSKDLKILFLEKEKLQFIDDAQHSPHFFIRSLLGNKWDIELIEKLQKYPKISEESNPTIRHGAIIKGRKKLKKLIQKIKNKGELQDEELIETVEKLKELGVYEPLIFGNAQEFEIAYKQFFDKIVASEQISDNFLPLVKPKNIANYRIIDLDKFIDYGPWLSRPRDKSLFEGRRIYIRETVKTPYRMCANLCEEKVITDHNYVFKIDDNDLSYFYLAFFNSLLASYFLSFTSPRLATRQNTEISKKNLENLPFPQFIDEEVFKDIVTLAGITHKLRNSVEDYDNEGMQSMVDSLVHKYYIENLSGELFDQLLYIQDELIFEFYGLNGKERQRIRDFFIPPNEKVGFNDLEVYAKTFKNILSPYIAEDSDLYYNRYIPAHRMLDFATIKFIINGKEGFKRKKTGSYDTIIEFIGYELLKNKNVSFIPGGHFEIYQDNQLFVVKPIAKKMWSKTKAIEDATSELEKIRLHYAR